MPPPATSVRLLNFTLVNVRGRCYPCQDAPDNERPGDVLSKPILSYQEVTIGLRILGCRKEPFLESTPIFLEVHTRDKGNDRILACFLTANQVRPAMSRPRSHALAKQSVLHDLVKRQPSRSKRIPWSPIPRPLCQHSTGKMLLFKAREVSRYLTHREVGGCFDLHRQSGKNHHNLDGRRELIYSHCQEGTG